MIAFINFVKGSPSKFLGELAMLLDPEKLKGFVVEIEIPGTGETMVFTGNPVEEK